MDDHFIHFSELLLLAAIGASPALVLALAAQTWWARSKGWFRQQRYSRYGVLVLITAALTIAFTVLGWVLLPAWFLSILPASAGMVSSILWILALPSALGAAAAIYLSRVALPASPASPGPPG